MDGPLHSKVIEHPDVEPDNDEEFKGLTLGFRTICQEYLASLTGLSIPPAIVAHMKNTVKLRPVGITCDIFASLIDTSFQEKLEILVMTDVKERMRRVGKFLKRQIQVIGISRKLLNSVDDTINKKQREMILRQQMAAIKKELGETTESNSPDSIQALEIKLEAANLPKEAKSVATKELARLKRIPNTAAEHQVIRNYLDCILDIPWSISTIDNNNISKARESLDADHFGMEKVKERIIQYLAVRKLKNDVKGPIMCLLGPPGVGKTSLGKSIANALGRKFHRISLGGVHDEAEIRGHRRTYVASMPGLLVQALIRCGSNNPVILLDEIDKVGRDSRGDPSAALLEVLDPEQNSAFTDHYLNVPIDLSNVLFIATANDSETIRAPLLDRTV